MKNIIFIAPPAAGKGTQSDLLKEEYGYKHISTGNLLRSEIACGSEFGQKIDKILKEGQLVSDEIVSELLKLELTKFDKNDKFILDGYPRTIAQAQILDKLFEELNIQNYFPIYLDIDKQMAKQRATGRIICENCNAIYHLYGENMKPKEADICDKCGGKLYQRPDDTEEAFNKRFDTYVENTTPVIDYYKEKNKLINVKVCESKYETLNNILVHLKKD